MTPPTSQIFTDAVTLKPCAAEVFDHAFTATTQPCPWPKAYGGDMVAQALVAATRTVGDGKAIHSAHSYFMRPVDIGADPCTMPEAAMTPGMRSRNTARSASFRGRAVPPPARRPPEV